LNYKFLKKKINDIVGKGEGKTREIPVKQDGNPKNLATSASEVDFFKILQFELKKASKFFSSSEEIYKIRYKRLTESYEMLRKNESVCRFGLEAWTQLLNSCAKFYRDVLLLENFAIMNYCGFSKILKKHDKLTG
jgi:SPX domain protein involved in polyphosphate accumulation